MRFAVGYQTINLVEGPNLLGVNFEKVGSETMGLADVLITKDKLTSINTSFTSFSGDYIDTWDTSTGDWGPTYQYCDISAYGAQYTDAWLNGSFQKVNPEVQPGSAFWLFCKNAVEGISFAGQVGLTGDTVVLVQGANLLANSKPMSLNLSDKSQVEITGQTSINSSFTSFSGDYIDTWDLTAGDWGRTYQYCNIPTYGEAYTDCWINSSFQKVDTAIPSGSGYWYFAKEAGVTITFK